jgi:hypothetical protein
MAYSDYGGYAYRNGVRVKDRSDAVLTPDGVKATPGMWPGWVLTEGRSGESHHALLGDGPIFVGLYKQSTVRIYQLGEELSQADFVVTGVAPDAFHEWGGRKYVDSQPFVNADAPVIFEVDGRRLEVRWAEEDNYYVYARLTQPDGVVWTGFSGYGVGAGLEDAGYGYSTGERERELSLLFGSR